MKTFNLQRSIFVAVLALITLFSACSKKTEQPAPTEYQGLSIKSFSPREARSGQLVTIKGTGFGNERSLIRVHFGNSEAVRPVSSTDTTIVAVVPPDAAAGRIHISILLGASVTSDDVFNLVTDVVDYPNFNKIQFTGSGSLSGLRNTLASGAAGNKILIAGGVVDQTAGLNTDYDIYDVSNNTWQSGRLSQPRSDLAIAGIGNKILIAGGNVAFGNASKIVDIYDVNTNTWTTSELSVARTEIAAAASGSEVFFAGGYDSNGKPSDVIDIYNVNTGKWRTAKLSVARGGLVAAASGSAIVFAGGDVAGSTDLDGKVVDIYATDGPKAGWSTARLNIQRFKGLAAVGNGGRIVLAGGATTAQDPFMEIYDTSNDVWTKFPINEEIHPVAAAAAGTKIVFSYGRGRSLIYDVYSNSVTSIIHAGETIPKTAVGLKNRIVFAGGIKYDTFTVFK